jgi:hypothetical protein
MDKPFYQPWNGWSVKLDKYLETKYFNDMQVKNILQYWHIIINFVKIWFDIIMRHDIEMLNFLGVILKVVWFFLIFVIMVLFYYIVKFWLLIKLFVIILVHWRDIYINRSG